MYHLMHVLCAFAIKVHWAGPMNVSWGFLYTYNNNNYQASYIF